MPPLRQRISPRIALLVLLNPACFSPEGGPGGDPSSAGPAPAATATTSDTEADTSGAGPGTTTTTTTTTGDDPTGPVTGSPSSTSVTTSTDSTSSTTTAATTNSTSGVCGDEIVDPGEECDDGDDDDQDECPSNCKHARCGDGFVREDVEQCDDGPANADDAPCTSACLENNCGDLLVCPACGEECEIGERGCTELCDFSVHFVFLAGVPLTAPQIGGLAGADALCALRAQKNEVLDGRTFVAWLSSSTKDAKERIGLAVGPYVRTDGVIVAGGGTDDLLDAMLDVPITTDELGNPASDLFPVWTGTGADGVALPGGMLCGDWTQSDGFASVGISTAINFAWSAYMDQNCNEPAYLYCIQTAY